MGKDPMSKVTLGKDHTRKKHILHMQALGICGNGRILEPMTD